MPEQIFETLPWLKEPTTIVTAIGIALLAIVTFINKIIKGIQPSILGFQNILDHKDKILKQRIADKDLDEDLRELLKKKLNYRIFEKETGIWNPELYEPIITVLKENSNLTYRMFFNSQDYLKVDNGTVTVKFNKWHTVERIFYWIGAVAFGLLALLFALISMLINDFTEIRYYLNMLYFSVMLFSGLFLFGKPLVRYHVAKKLQVALEEKGEVNG